jgi:hypothetical protein
MALISDTGSTIEQAFGAFANNVTAASTLQLGDLLNGVSTTAEISIHLGIADRREGSLIYPSIRESSPHKNPDFVYNPDLVC